MPKKKVQLKKKKKKNKKKRKTKESTHAISRPKESHNNLGAVSHPKKKVHHTPKKKGLSRLGKQKENEKEKKKNEGEEATNRSDT